MALRRPLLLVGGMLVSLALGCQGPAEEDSGEVEGAFYGVPTAKEGEARQVVLSNVKALSRDPDERRKGLADDVIATWHVHHIVTDGGFAGVVMYGADDNGMVRLSFVIDDSASSLVIVEPDEKDTSEAALSEVTGKAHAPISPAMLKWFADEFGRLGRESAAAEKSGGDIQARGIVFNPSWKCAARITTMVLAMASGIVLSPVGGVVVAAAEAAAWGDFGGAAVIGGIGGANAATTAMKQSGVAAVRKAGGALKGLGIVGMVGLVGVALVLDPKEAIQGLVPAQCK